MRLKLKTRTELDEHYRIQARKHDIHVSDQAVSVIATQGLHGMFSSLGLLDVFIKRRVVLIDGEHVAVFRASCSQMKLKDVIAAGPLSAVSNERTFLRYQHWVLGEDTFVIHPGELARAEERSGGAVSIPSHLIE